MTKQSAKSGRKKPFSRFEITRFVEYMISGGLYFWSGYLVFFIADKGLHWNLLWAKTAANGIGWTVNYLLQRFWVFQRTGLKKHRTEVTFRYAIITLVDFGLDYLIVYGLKRAGLTPYLGQFVSAGFFTVWNYVWYRSWVFVNRTHRRHKLHTAKQKPAVRRRAA